MKRYHKVAWVLIIAAVLTGIWRWQNREPTYQGRSLWKWVELSYVGSPAEVREAGDAFVAMQERAIPHCLRLVREPAAKLDENAVMWRLLNTVGNKGWKEHYLQRQVYQPEADQLMALKVLSSYGPAASAGIPDYRRLLGAGGRYSYQAALALYAAGGEGREILRQGLGHSDVYVRVACAAALAANPADTENARPILLAALPTGDSETRSVAADGLTRIPTDREKHVQLLIPFLRDSDPLLPLRLSFSFAQMGPTARSALPELRILSGSPPYRYVANVAIKRIEGGQESTNSTPAEP